MTQLTAPPPAPPEAAPPSPPPKESGGGGRKLVRDLLGDQTSPANLFPPEDFVNGFKNQYAAQNLSPLLADSYSAAAEKLARSAMRLIKASHSRFRCGRMTG